MESFTPLASLLGGGLTGLAASLLLLGEGQVAGISGIVGGRRHAAWPGEASTIDRDTLLAARHRTGYRYGSASNAQSAVVCHTRVHDGRACDLRRLGRHRRSCQGGRLLCAALRSQYERIAGAARGLLPRGNSSSGCTTGRTDTGCRPEVHDAERSARAPADGARRGVGSRTRCSSR